MTLKCSKCGQAIQIDQQVFQTRLGHWTKRPYQTFGMDKIEMIEEFETEQDIEYWHVHCPIPTCDHRGDPVMPAVIEVMDSPAYKIMMQELEQDSPSSRYHYRFHWKKTEFGEQFLTITVRDRQNQYDEHERKFAFVKCATCGVIQSV